jgi:hypothetical protein
MNTTPSQLVSFLSRLRLQSAQFQISDSQFLAAHQLIGGLAGGTEWGAQWPPTGAEWCALLGPVLCSSAVDLAQFQKEFERYFQSSQPEIPTGTDPPRREPAQKKRWLTAVAVGLAVGAVATGIAVLHKPARTDAVVSHTEPVKPLKPPDPNGRVTVTVTDRSRHPVSEAIVKFRGQFPKTNSAGEVTADFTKSPGTHYLLVTHPKYQTDVETIPGGQTNWSVFLKPGVATASSGEPRPNWFGSHAVALYPAAIVIPLLAFLVWLWRLLRTALELRRKITGAHEQMQQIGFDQAGGNLFCGADIRRLATGLRRRRFEESDDLAVEATAEATARAAGYFTPVFARRQTEPEYLAILEQKNSRDHQTRLQDELFSRLRDYDVAIRRFYFQNDPSVCFDSDNQIFSLSELAARHPSQELWVSCEADKCVNPVTGKMQQWTQALTYWKDRVLLSGLAVEPAVAVAAEIRAAAPTRAGLESLTSDAPQGEHTSSAPEMFLEHPEDWLDPTDPGAHRLASLTLHLRRYLGPNGYLCLQACAIYPEIAWNITASAAAALVPDEDEIETVLERMSMLPWMRHGFMPEWFRIGLVRALGSNEQKARDWLATYLTSGTPGEQRAEALNVVPGGEQNGAGKSTLPETDRDRVYLWFASGKRLEDLSASAPRTWFKLMVAPLIRRVLAVLTTTATVAVAACMAIAFLSRTSPVDAQPTAAPERPKNLFVATMLDAAYGLASLNVSKTEAAVGIASDVLDVLSPVPNGADPQTFLAASERAGATRRDPSGPKTGDIALSTKRGGVIQVVRNVTREGTYIFGDLRAFRAADFDLGFLDFSTAHLVSKVPAGVIPSVSAKPLPEKPADWDASPGPNAGWCYQETKTSGMFGAYCHWSQANCVTTRSAAATRCVYVTGLRKTPWRPAPKGIDDSWFDDPLSSPLPPPFPQLSVSGSPTGDTSARGTLTPAQVQQAIAPAAQAIQPTLTPAQEQQAIAPAAQTNQPPPSGTAVATERPAPNSAEPAQPTGKPDTTTPKVQEPVGTPGSGRGQQPTAPAQQALTGSSSGPGKVQSAAQEPAKAAQLVPRPVTNLDKPGDVYLAQARYAIQSAIASVTGRAPPANVFKGTFQDAGLKSESDMDQFRRALGALPTLDIYDPPLVSLQVRYDSLSTAIAVASPQTKIQDYAAGFASTIRKAFQQDADVRQKLEGVLKTVEGALADSYADKDPIAATIITRDLPALASALSQADASLGDLTKSHAGDSGITAATRQASDSLRVLQTVPKTQKVSTIGALPNLLSEFSKNIQALESKLPTNEAATLENRRAEVADAANRVQTTFQSINRSKYQTEANKEVASIHAKLYSALGISQPSAK